MKTTSSQEIERKHCLSFDVEEHFQVSAFDRPERRRQWDQLESRVERNTEKLLVLLAENQVHATFFVLGWIAQRYSRIVRRIIEGGHEVASHGYSHKMITEQTQAGFRNDVRKSKAVLEDLTGSRVEGYRAPSFSITKDTKWALPILVDEGYRYDSSVFPIYHDRYGLPGATPTIHRWGTESGPLWEIPPTTVSVAGFRIPVAGGGYFRLFPYPIFRRLLKRVDQTQPLVVYFHPWELDPDQPRMDGPLISRFRHYVNLRKTTPRLFRLLEDFSFGPIREILSSLDVAGQR